MVLVTQVGEQIVTGAQIPLSQLRNDAVDNLLGSLTLAGHFIIPGRYLDYDLCYESINRGTRGVLVFQSHPSPWKSCIESIIKRFQCIRKSKLSTFGQW